MLDDNRWTSWQTEYDLTRPSAWLRVDLPGQRPLGRVRWFITNGGLAPDYDVEALAADGQTWVALPDATGLTAAAGASWSERAVALEARAVRFTFRNVSPKPVPRLGSIGSVELYAGGGE